jgi:hypothetical protein
VTDHEEHPEYDEAGPGPDDTAAPDVEEVRDPRIAAAVARLDGLTDTPPVEHVEVYEDVHRVLQDALADAALTSESADPGVPGPEGARP